MKKILLILFIFSSLTSFSQTTDVAKIKYRLTEYLLSCQSIAYSVFEEKDTQRRLFLISYGNKYYNTAYYEYSKLDNPELNELSEELKKVISISLETYATLFTDVTNFDNPVYTVALAMLDVQYKKYFLPIIWNSEKLE